MSEDPRDTLMLRRSLKLLNGILKEFASLKMLNGVKTMAKVNRFKINVQNFNHHRYFQITEDLHLILYGYYSQMSASITPSTITPQSISSTRTHDDILLAHLVYKCNMKMAIWLWQRIDRIAKEEQYRNRNWVSSTNTTVCYCLSYT